MLQLRSQYAFVVIHSSKIIKILYARYNGLAFHGIYLVKYTRMFYFYVSIVINKMFLYGIIIDQLCVTMKFFE